MCGIAGFTRRPGATAASDTATLRAMLAPIAHRGPDATGVHVAGPVAFGHLRLAIIDLAGGAQPRVDETSGDALIFNGEIYGYATLAAELAAAGVNLADRSDTEVLFRLLQRDGIEATLARIDGMFAFAFYEGRTGRLHLARDRFGEKPLYWLQQGGQLVFASEPRAVAAHPLGRDLPIDLGAVATFLAFEYLPGNRSLRHGMRKLPPGHRLVLQDGSVQLHAYWRPDPDEAGRQRRGESEAEKLDRLDALLHQSVRERLVADVPVGVFLSGGVDSSLIAALVGARASSLTAFTVAMPQAGYDEAPAAAALARRFGLRHEIVPLDDAALAESFHAIGSRMDEPLADPSLLAAIALCRRARGEITVAVGGDGADELFAGYVSFKANRLARAMAQIPPVLGRLARRALAHVPQRDSYMSADFLLAQLSQAAGLAPARQWTACMAPFAPEEADALWRADARSAAQAAAYDPVADLVAARGNRRWATSELLHLFTSTYLPEDILQKVDRASMYASLEVRSPYLARGFAEYALSLPSSDKLHGWSTKVLFRKLALRHLPRSTVDRRKHGFAVPLARLLRGPLREPVGEAILGERSPLGAWFRRPVLEQLWREHASGARDHRKKIWTLFTLATAARA